MFKNRRNTYHNASKWAHSHTLIVGLGLLLLSATFAWNIGNMFYEPQDQTASAQEPAVCGNGIIEGEEQCDDGNQNPNDGCSETCQFEILLCTDLKIRSDGDASNIGYANQTEFEFIHNFPSRATGIYFDYGNGETGVNNTYTYSQSNTYTVNAYANHPYDPSQQNLACSIRHGQAYEVQVLPEPICGNGIVEFGEQCDDENLDDGDGCDSTCQREPRDCSRITGFSTTGEIPHIVEIEIDEDITTSDNTYIETINRGNGYIREMPRLTDLNTIYTIPGAYMISIDIFDRGGNITCDIPIEVTGPYCGDGEINTHNTGHYIDDVSYIDIYALSEEQTVYNGNTGSIITLSAELIGGQIASGYNRHLSTGIAPGGVEANIIGSSTGQTVEIVGVNQSNTDLAGNLKIEITTTSGYTIETIAIIIIKNKTSKIGLLYPGVEIITIDENEVFYSGYQMHLVGQGLISPFPPFVNNMPITMGKGNFDWYNTNAINELTGSINYEYYVSEIPITTEFSMIHTINGLGAKTSQELLLTSNRELFEEQCDDGNNIDGDGCDTMCQLEPLTCTLSIDHTTGYADRTAFTYDVITADRATDVSFDYGDGGTGPENTHIYSTTGTHTVTAYVTHPYDANEVVTCTNEVYIIEDQEPAQCQIIIEPGFKLQGYSMSENEEILETLIVQDSSVSLHDIVEYQRSIQSSGINESSYIFDDSIIKSGTGTDTIELDFSDYTDQAKRPRIWISLTVIDERGNTAESKNLLHRWHGGEGSGIEYQESIQNQGVSETPTGGGIEAQQTMSMDTEHYTLIGDTITDYLIVGSEVNIKGTVNASIAINGLIVDYNDFLITQIGFPTQSQTAIDRENNSIIDEQFTYTEPYTTSYTYNDTGSKILVLQTLGGGIQDPIAHRHYAVECTECPVGSITSEDLVIDVYKGLQSESNTFPGGIVPYYVKATNESSGATLQNITIVDVISDNAHIISYSFEYNDILYTVPVDSGAFIIDSSITQEPIQLAPGEMIEIIIYAGIQTDGDIATNYIFAGGNWVPDQEGVEICELEDSDAQNQCARTNEQNTVPNDRQNFTNILGLIQFDDFQVCADNDQGASTETATCNAEEGECQLDPDITLEKTLVDNQGNPTESITIGQEATFIIDLTFTNLRPHNFNRSAFSLTDYLSGSVTGTSGLNITSINFNGSGINYEIENDEYVIDLSNIYETNDYTPMCMTFERGTGDHIGTDWSQFPFISTSNGGPNTGYQAFLPAEAIASGYNRITRYEIQDNGELPGFRYYPGQNDQWFGGTAIRTYFNDHPHTVRVCQPIFQGNGINEFDDISLEVTAIITDAGYVDEDLVCNEVNLSYNNEFDLTDDVCFDVTCGEGQEYCAISNACVAEGTCESECEEGYTPENGICTLECSLTTDINATDGIVPHEVTFTINTGIATQRYIDYGNGFTGKDNPYTYNTSGTYITNLYVVDPATNERQTCEAGPTIVTTCADDEQLCNGECIPNDEICPECDEGELYCPLNNLCLTEGELCGESICGNEIIELGEKCEVIDGEIVFAPGTPEALQDPALCNINSCQLDSGCGDGYRDEHGLYGPAEQCDYSDPNAENSEECSLLCTLQICVQNYVETQWTTEQCEATDNGPSLRWLVIDKSGSMGRGNQGVTRMQDAQAAVTGMLEIMEEADIIGGVLISGDMIGISSFNQQASLDIGFTGDFEAVAQAVIGLTPSGTTNIASGIQIGYNEFMANTTLASGTNQYMIVLSDGQANAPNFSDAGPLAVAVGDLVKDAGIKVYSISVGAPQAYQTMSQIASPGSFYELQSSSMLAEIFAGIYYQETCNGTEQVANVLCCELNEEPYSTNNDNIMNECCPEGSSVINGECVLDICTNGATNPPDCDICPTGSILINGQCVPTLCPNGATNRPNCDTCPTGFSLIDGQCTPLCINGATNPPECDVCPTGFTLIDGQCEPTICTDDQDCPEGFACIGDECVPMVCTNGAINRPDCDICPTGFTLIDGQCEPTICTDDEDCPDGYICLDGTCIAQCTNGATNPPDCNICEDGSTLIDGQCIPDTCTDDEDCPEGYICLDGTCVAQCTNGAINPPDCNICEEGSTLVDGQCIPDTCTDDEDCPEGYVCIGDECVAQCTNGATNPPDCDICPSGQTLVNNQCVNTSGGGGPGGGTTMDYCPDGDFSGSYYDGECGEMIHPTAPIGRFCIYDDEDYLENGPFEDSLGHRGYPYVEIMRVSCLHRGRETNQNRWMYQPDGYIQRDEALKTFVKTLGIQFGDFTIETEDQRYPYVTPFLDVPQNHRFAHYAQYAKNEGITSHLEGSDTDGTTLNPGANMTRFEAIKTLIDTYEKIVGQSIEFSGESNMTDVQDSSDRYYDYIRKAEELGFISGFPESDGTYTFRGNNLITRAEFAKIIANAFNKQLLNVEDIVLTSQLYATIAKSIHEVEGNKLLFINELLENMENLDDVVFINEYKVKKSVFIDILYEKVFIPMAEFYMQQQ